MSLSHPTLSIVSDFIELHRLTMTWSLSACVWHSYKRLGIAVLLDFSSSFLVDMTGLELYHLFSEVANFSSECCVSLVEPPGRDFGNGRSNFRSHRRIRLAGAPPVDLKQLFFNLSHLQCQAQNLNILSCFIELPPATQHKWSQQKSWVQV